MAKVAQAQLEEDFSLRQHNLEELDVVIRALVGEAEELATVPCIRINPHGHTTKIAQFYHRATHPKST